MGIFLFLVKLSVAKGLYNIPIDSFKKTVIQLSSIYSRENILHCNILQIRTLRHWYLYISKSFHCLRQDNLIINTAYELTVHAFYCWYHVKPANIHVMRILRNAPPSNVVRTKSDKVSRRLLIYVTARHFHYWYHYYRHYLLLTKSHIRKKDKNLKMFIFLVPKNFTFCS